MSPRDVLLALLVVAIWGFNFVVIKVGLATVPPLLMTAARFFLAAVPAVFFVARPACAWRWVVGFGLVLGVAKFSALLIAMKIGMPAGLSSLVLQTQAFFTMAFAVVFLRERPLPVQIAGAVVAFLGVAVIALARSGGAGAGLGPLLLVLVAAACWGLANIVAKKAGRVNMLAFVVWSSLVAPLPLLALSLIFEGPQAIATAVRDMTPLAFGTILFQAWPTTLLGFGIWTALLSRLPVATVAPFSLLVPVAGIASAAWVLGEPLGAREIAGSALVFVGLLANVFGPRLAARLRRG